MNTLTPLQERRLAELKQVVAARATGYAPTRRTGRRILRPALALATTTAGVAGVAGAVIGLVAATGGGTPAFAVTKSASGVVTIKITDYRDTSQLTAELQGLGIPAAVVYIPAGEYCYQPNANLVFNPPEGLSTVPASIPGGLEITFDTRLFQPGQSLIFGLGDAVTNGVHADGVAAFVVTGQLTACQFRPQPPNALPPALRHLKSKVVVIMGAQIKFPNDNY